MVRLASGGITSGDPVMGVMATAPHRIRVEVHGIVQGVGFRPFVYRLATARRLAGWVHNTAAGVIVEVEGEESDLSSFVSALQRQAPPLAVISAVTATAAEPTGESGFFIAPSSGSGHSGEISPDCDVCPDCLQELFDPADRRYRYPFITCTNCGPRYSIITGIPYDRPLTTMAGFPLCDRCRAEYEDSENRRFHAQPVACPECGPRLRLLDGKGGEVAGDPVETAVAHLHAGKIVAVKGVGGYHLAVDPGNDAAVRMLRERKKRDEKPFALMAADLVAVELFARADGTEKRLLAGPERPIVLLTKRADHPFSPLVAPANGYFGVMLPAAPLHHLLLRGNFSALVMTSGNVSDDPIAYRDAEARSRLGEIADFFLVHDRDIHVPSDDSVLRVFRGNPLFLRRSRGFVPRSVRLPFSPLRLLACGAELKSTVCLTTGDRAFVSQHVGDLKNVETFSSLAEASEHLQQILGIKPEAVAHDLHPDYFSTRYAEGFSDLPRVAVQHHHAHLAACMAENGLDEEVLGVIYDGAGYGPDGTVWGGEFLLGGYREVERVGYFRPLPLPGGDAAVREPYRMALACLFPLFGERMFDLPLPPATELLESERPLFVKMLERGINSPLTSSCGRLFDAVASLLGVRNRVSYEGQAAIELEGLAEGWSGTEIYPFALAGGRILDFSTTVAAIVADLGAGRARGEIAALFHETVAAATASMCRAIRGRSGIGKVLLSGGVFQNRLLTDSVCRRLEEEHFQVFTHRLLPPNDGGISLGQAAVAGMRLMT